MNDLHRKVRVFILHPFKRAARFVKRRVTMLLQRVYLTLAIIMVVSFVASLASSLTPNATISALLSKQSWDLEALVQQASDTRPWNDNGARAYGPVTHIGLPILALALRQISACPTFLSSNRMPPNQFIFFLTMIAGLSAIAVGWVIGCALTINLANRLVSAVVFGSVLLQTEVWRHQIFIVHPDVVLAPFAAGLAFFLLKGVIDGQRAANIPQVSLMLGLGLATKVSFIYFVPPIIGAYLSRNIPRMIMRLSFIAALAFFVYIAIGFPQSLFVHEVIGAMLDQKRVLATATTESMLRWSGILFDIFGLLAGVMILLSVTIADSRLMQSLALAKPRILAVFTILALLPSLLLIFTMNFIPSFVSATSHYSIGFSAYTAVGIALMIAAVTFRVLALLPDRIEKIRKIIGPIILVSYVFLTGATVPPYINETSKTHEMSRVEGVRLIEQINFLAETGAVPLITPYFPNFQLPGQEGLGKSRFEKEISSPQGQANGIFLMIDPWLVFAFSKGRTHWL